MSSDPQHAVFDSSPEREAPTRSIQVAERIAEQIITGELAAGERIPELRLTRELNVSRSSVREALLILQRSHLIQIFPNRGATVSELAAGDVQALFEVLGWQLQAVMERVSDQWRESELIVIQPLADQLYAHAQSGHFEAFYDQVFAFLQQCHQWVNNPYWLEIFNNLMPSIRRCYFLTLTTSRRELQEACNLFELVLEAILIRRGEQAGLFVANFCQHLRQLVLESLSRMKQIELAWARRIRR